MPRRHSLLVPGLVLAVCLAAAHSTEASTRVTFQAEDGVSIAATVFEPSRQPAPAVVLVHVQTRNRHDWDGAAEQLAARGLAALAIDLRGHGESGGSADPSAMVRDVRAGVRYLLSRRDLATPSIGIAGGSMGANLAVVAGVEEGVVRSLALLSPGMDIHGVRTEAAMKKVGGRAVLLLASRDDYYAVRSCGVLAQEVKGSLEFKIVDGTAHGTVMLSRVPETLATLLDWFQRTLL